MEASNCRGYMESKTNFNVIVVLVLKSVTKLVTLHFVDIYLFVVKLETPHWL